MRSLFVLTVVLFAALWTAFPAFAQDDDKEPTFEESFAAKLEEWLPQMGAEKIPDRRGAQQALQDNIFSLGGPGHEEELKTACAVIAAKLGPDTAAPARVWLLHVLEFSGGAECVDAAAECLDERDSLVRDAARRCLANVPAPQANQELLDALAKARDADAQVALINALGYRADEKSVSSLAGLLNDRDRTVVAAAANALGKIANDEATRALKSAAGKAKPPVLEDIVDAYFRCADRLLDQGKKAEAKAIYAEWIGEAAPKAIRMAAMTGMLKAAGGK